MWINLLGQKGNEAEHWSSNTFSHQFKNKFTRLFIYVFFPHSTY